MHCSHGEVLWLCLQNWLLSQESRESGLQHSRVCQCSPVFLAHASEPEKKHKSDVSADKIRTTLQKRQSFFACPRKTTKQVRKKFLKPQTDKQKTHHTNKKKANIFQSKTLFKNKKGFNLVHILNTNTNLLDFQPNKSSVQSHQSQHQHHFELLLLEP